MFGFRIWRGNYGKIFGVLIVFFLVSSTMKEGHTFSSDEEPVFVLPQKHESNLTSEEQRGQILYEYYCTLCHGMRGEADGFNSYSMSVSPIRHSDNDFMGTLSDTQIKLAIKEGGRALDRSPYMPPWGGALNDQEISDLTAYIRTLASVPDEGEK